MDDRSELEHRIARLERRIRDLENLQRSTDAQLLALQSSLVFDVLRRVGQPLLNARARVRQWLNRSSAGRSLIRLLPAAADPYPLWVKGEIARERPAHAHSASPSFLVLLSAGAADLNSVRESVASLIRQKHVGWQAMVSDDSLHEAVREELAALAGSNDRVHIGWKPGSELPAGDYVMRLDAGDVLASDALFEIAAAAPADMIYTDEDRIDAAGNRSHPIFKPGWSPELLLSCLYIGRGAAIRRSLWHELHAATPYTELTEYDEALWVSERSSFIRHVGRVLYHRSNRGMDRARDARARDSGRRSLSDALARRGASVQIEDDPENDAFRPYWRAAGDPLATLIICSRTPDLLDKCLASIARCTTGVRREIIVVEHLGYEHEAMKAIIERRGVRSIEYPGPFNFSRMNNSAAAVAKGGILVFVNDDIQPLEPSWLSRLAGQAARPEIGAAGARLFYPSGALQHAGVAVGVLDGCGHIGRGLLASSYWPWLNMTRDVTAVTGACMAIRTAVFKDLGSFDESFPVNYNDIDLCLRARKAGYRVVFESGAILRHDECQTRRGVVTYDEKARWLERWGDLAEFGDEFYSPNLTRAREDLSLREWSR